MKAIVTSHGQSTATAMPTRSNLVKPGRFGLLFPELPCWSSGDPDNEEVRKKDENILVELAAAMHASPDTGEGIIPAGFTYFGQFVDHDITFDPTPIGENMVDRMDLVNFRKPALDLDCLYGSGPADQPFLYQRSSDPKLTPRFLIGPVIKRPGEDNQQAIVLDGALYDLPRVCDGLSEKTAVLGDKRNDENLIVAQLHRTMLHFHNAVCIGFPDLSFDDVRKTVIHHYQRILLNQFLPLIAGEQAVKGALQELRFYKVGPGELSTNTFIPLEFSGAAYRFGHSLVRSTYHFNVLFPNDRFDFAFQFTGNGGFFGLPRYPSNWLLDWRQFFEIVDAQSPQKPKSKSAPLKAMPVDASLSNELLIGPKRTPLAELNLKRGRFHYKLPSGQELARRMGIDLLTEKELTRGVGGNVIADFNLGNNTPLWFYLLKEAEVRAKGEHLGPVGAAIVAEVFVGLLKNDPESVLCSSTPQILPSEIPDKFEISDLFNFIESFKGQGNIPVAGVINPLGDAP